MNACRLRSKHEELEALAQSQSCCSFGLSEAWLRESCDWRAVMEGYRLFGRERQGRQGSAVCKGVVGLYSVCSGGEMVEHVWVNIRGKSNKADIAVEVNYTSPRQEGH